MRRAAACLLVLVAACGGGSSGPGDAAVDTVQRIFDEQWGPLYANLHPEHQQLVSRDAFGACAGEVFGDRAVLDSLEAVDSYQETVTIPFTETEVESTAVTVEAAVGDHRDRTTVHMVDVDGEWRWYLSTPSDFRSCQGGTDE